MVDGYQFWKIVDECNPYDTVLELSEKIGATYTKIRQQRANGTFPKAADLYRISKEVNKPMEFLMTGQEYSKYSERIERIAENLMYYASEEDIMLVERILRIPPKNNTIPNSQKTG